jgi:membrane protein DedA with SNARE-associated domain
MQYRRFFLANASGALLWGVAFSLLGYFAGSALTRIESFASWFGVAMLVVLVTVIVTIYFLRRRRDLEGEESSP